MLDERKEYSLYKRILDNPNDCIDNLITFRALENGLSGLKHILEVIARGRLFNSGNPDFNAAQNDIKQWITNLKNKENSMNNPDNMDTLRTLCAEIAPSKRFEKKNEDGTISNDAYTFIIRKLVGFESRAEKSPFDMSDANSCDYNKATFQGIVATAYETGPLKTYLMLAKEDFFNNQYVLKHPSDNKTKLSNLTNGEMDYLLKLTASFLMNNRDLKKRSVRVINADVTNWASIKTIENEFILGDYFENDKGEPIFSKIPISYSENLFKLEFNRQWLYNFLLIDVTESGDLSKYKGNYTIYYKDDGPGNILLKETL